MRLIQMSISVSIFVTMVLVIRGFGKKNISRSAIVFLWDLIIIRALVPFRLKLIRIPVSEKAGTTLDISDLQEKVGNISAPLYRQPVHQEAVEAVQRSRLWSWEDVFSVIWIVGVVFLAVYFIKTYRKEYQGLKKSIPVYSELVERMMRIRPVSRKVEVYQNERFLTPVTYGTLHPKIVLPAGTSELSRVDMRNMIVHELVHIRRWDVAKRFFLIAALCIHWFNPWVWLMFWLYQQDQEISCDEQVLKRMNSQRSKNYIYTMIKMSSKGGKFLAVHGFAGESFGKKRILAALGGKHKRGIQTLAMFLAGTFFILSFVSFTPSGEIKSLNQDIVTAGEKSIVLAAQEQESIQQLVPSFEEMILTCPLTPQNEDFDFLAVMRDIEENCDLSEPLTDEQRVASNIKCYITIAELCKEKMDRGIKLSSMELWLVEEYYDYVRKNYVMDEETEKEYQHWREVWMSDIVL